MQRPLPPLWRQPESGKLQLREHHDRSALGGTGRYSQEAGTLRTILLNQRKVYHAKSKTAALQGPYFETPRPRFSHLQVSLGVPPLPRAETAASGLPEVWPLQET